VYLFCGEKLIMPKQIAFALILWATVPLWSQEETTQPQQPVPAMVGADTSAVPAETYNPSEDRMITPPPVSGQAYPIALGSQERSNYLRAGVFFTGAYNDNVPSSAANGSPISDQSYSVGPMIALDETTPRLHYLLSYAPAFTFYQHTSSRNEGDHNASLEFEYRLSPHVTLSATDTFQKSSNVLNQVPNLSSGGVVSGGAQGSNYSVIAPIADHLSNSGNASFSYQYALNDMVGASGTLSNIHYPDQSQVPGLADSSSQAGLAFYSHRVGRGQYVGVTYQYQRLLSHLGTGDNETQTHAALFFYTYAPSSSRFSFSFFGGPQHADTVEPPFPPQQLETVRTRSWDPAGGASLGWQGRMNSFALSYMHVIAGGGGLTGAVQQDSATVSGRQQITRTLSASLTGGYSQNNVIGSGLNSNSDGHTISGTVSLERQIGQRLGVQLGYTRLYQSYNNVAVLSATPDTNRVFVSISYQFSRPLGR
jgi:hypothetical protein